MFRRLDAKTGKIRWETNVRGNAPQYFFHGDVFIAPDRIVTASDVDPSIGAIAGVRAFDRESGRQLWFHPAGRGVLGAIIGSGDRVFAYASKGDLIALNLESGKPEWTYALKASPWESPAASASRVFAASSDGSVYAFENDAGRVEWQQKLGSPVSTSVRVAESDLYAGTADGTMHRLATTSGEVRSFLKLDTVLQPSVAPMITRDAVLVLLTDQQADYRALVSLDRGLTRVAWRTAAPGRWSTSRIFVAGKTILLGTPSGEVIAYCAANGSLAWSHKLAGAPIRSIGGSDETLFVGTPQGALFAIRPPQSCT